MAGTFEVIHGDWSVINTTTGTVCFTCYFAIGATTDNCYIEYSSLYTGLVGNATILKRPMNESVATKCLNGFYTDIYTIGFYDDKHDNSVAYELHYQLMTGLFFDNHIPVTSCISSELSLSSHFSPSPSPYNTCNGK